MDNNLNIQDILKGIEELRKTQAENAVQQAVQQKEAQASLKETDAILKENAVQQKEIKASLKETDALLKKTVRKLDSIGDQLAAIGINTGQSAEEFFFRSVGKSLKLAGIQFDSIERNVSMSDELPEFDMVLSNGTHVMILEVKYKAHPDEVGELAMKKTENFRKLYPRYRNHALHFGIASMITNTDLVREARREGVCLLTQQGDHLAVVDGPVKSW